MTRAGPGHLGIGGGPEADTAGVQLVGIGGVHGEAEVIPGLASGVGAVDRPNEQIRRRPGLGIPGASTVLAAAPDSGESLVADLTGHGIDHARIGRAEGHRNSAQSIGASSRYWVLHEPPAS